MLWNFYNYNVLTTSHYKCLSPSSWEVAPGVGPLPDTLPWSFPSPDTASSRESPQALARDVALFV